MGRNDMNFSMDKFKDIYEDSPEDAEKYLQSCEVDEVMMILVGDRYKNGVFGTVEKEKARKIYIRLSEAGSGEATFQLGNLYEEEDQVDERLHWYRKAANLGSVNAMYCLGQWLADSDYSQAVRWFNEASKKGDIESALELSQLREERNEFIQAYEDLVPFIGKSADVDEAVFLLFSRHGVGDAAVIKAVKSRYLSRFAKLLKCWPVIAGILIALMLVIAGITVLITLFRLIFKYI